MPENAAGPRRYSAFISYRHADNQEPGRRWAEWIHQALETYHVPRELVGKPGLRGEPTRATLYPVFRDEEELPADSDLTQNLRRALEHSDLLVVICSPRAVASRFVDQEIRAFKELGKSDRILALIVDGEPNAGAAGRAEGVRPEMECLPGALRFGVRTPDGGVDWTQPTEPIAADARPGGRSEQGFTTAGAYGEALRRKGGLPGREVGRLQREYGERLELARLKVVAGVLGLPLGQLRARDAVYRARRFRRLAGVFGSLALVALLAAVVAVWQGRRAERNYEKAEAARLAQERQVIEASRHAHAAAERELRAGHWQEGVTWLGRALRYFPRNGPAAAHLWSVIAYGQGDRDEPPLAAWSFGEAIERMAASPNGRYLAVVTASRRLVLHDLATGGRRRAELPSLPLHWMRFSPGGQHVLLRMGKLEMYVVPSSAAETEPQVVRLDGDFHDATVSADGGTVIAAGVLHGLERLEPGTGRHTVAVGEPAQEHERQQVGALFSPDGSVVLVLPRKGPLRLLDVASGEPRAIGRVLAMPPLIDARLSARGTYLALRAEGALTVWELSTGRAVLTLPHRPDLWSSFDFSPEGDALVARAEDGTLELHGLPEGKVFGPRLRHVTPTLRAAFAGDGRRVLTAGADGQVASWPRPGALAPGSGALAPGPATSVRWLGTDRALVARDDRVEVWDVGTRTLVGRLDTGPLRGGIAVADDGAWIATAGLSGLVRVWDPVTLRPLREVEGLPLENWSLVPVGRGPLAIAAGYDLSNGGLAQRVRVLDVVSGKAAGPDVRPAELSHLQGMSADGRRLLVRAGMRAVWSAWTVADGSPLASVSPEDVRALEASEERAGVGILDTSDSPGREGRAILDLATRLPLTEPFASPGASLQWSPDGRRLLTVDAEGAVRIHATPLPGPPGPWFEDLVAAASGLRVDEMGLVRALTVDERQAARARLASVAIPDPWWARLVRWWLRPPAERAGGP